MSSLGPTLFFTGKNVNEIIDRISKDMPETICFNTSFNNKKRIIDYD